MDNFMAARSQMAMSLAFHIVFATIGVSLPLMMTISEWRWRSTVAVGAVILIPSLILLLHTFKTDRKLRSASTDTTLA